MFGVTGEPKCDVLALGAVDREVFARLIGKIISLTYFLKDGLLEISKPTLFVEHNKSFKESSIHKTQDFWRRCGIK